LGFIEFGDQLLSIYRENDFFLFPSYSEGLPQVILEAMANGCFVISTNVGSIPFIIKDNVNGILINPHNLDNIKKVIDAIFTQQFNIKSIRYNAIKSATMYSFENQINIFEKVLNG
jgi:glycosyltransferase involved in cell wall biosynthesis